MELVQQLKEDGKAKGLCRMWQMKLRTGLDYEQLIQLYIKGIDFCISENYPTLDFIREHFKGKCEVYGVFVDDEVTDKVNLPDVVLNGDCKAMLEYDGYSVSRVYARIWLDEILEPEAVGFQLQISNDIIFVLF